MLLSQICYLTTFLPSFLLPPSLPRKLTLEGLSWTVFDKDEEKETIGKQFVQLIHDLLTKPVGETAEVTVEPTLESARPSELMSKASRVLPRLLCSKWRESFRLDKAGGTFPLSLVEWLFFQRHSNCVQ